VVWSFIGQFFITVRDFLTQLPDSLVEEIPDSYKELTNETPNHR
jgi:hypothetical protein